MTMCSSSKMAPAILSSVIRYICIHAIRTYAFLPFLSFPSPIRSRASYGVNPVFGRFLTPWIPVPRLREDKLHGNDTDCVSPIVAKPPCCEIRLCGSGYVLLLQVPVFHMSFTYKPKRKKRARTHGFLSRMKTSGGRKALSRRRGKGRKKLTAS